MRLKKITSAVFEFDAETKFEIQALNAGAINTIRDAGSRSRIEVVLGEGGKAEPKRVIESHQKAEDEALISAAIIGWEGVTDADGKPMDCTPENKLRLCRELDSAVFTALIVWVNKKVREVDDLIAKQAEGSEKN